jgi:predicted amidophosphoribosyltransferase
MNNLLEGLRTALFPHRCLACGVALGASAPAFCGPCAVSLLVAPPGLLCLNGGALVPARGLWLYGGALRDALVRMKHQPSSYVAVRLGELLVQASPRAPSPEGLVVPVPGLPWHNLRRGFAPTLLLGRQLAQAWGWELAPALAMRGLGHSQAGRGGDQRRDRRRLRWGRRTRAWVEGRRVLLLDDVATTGATLREGAGLLLEAGAASVQALVLAVVEPLPWGQQPRGSVPGSAALGFSAPCGRGDRSGWPGPARSVRPGPPAPDRGSW